MIDPVSKMECACPLNGKLCIDGSREDFPKNKAGGLVKCRWWQHLAGKDPQSEKMVDQFDCAIAWMPTVTIEGAQMGRQTAASIDKLTNEVAGVNGRIAAQSSSIERAGAMIAQGIQNGTLQVLIPAKSENGETAHD